MDAITEQHTVLSSQSELRGVYQSPKQGVLDKNLSFIDRHSRRFIELSPFLCMGTMGADGLGDVTPRGGEQGFVHVLSDKQLAMPDRPGNNRIDALSNLVDHPGVGLLFFVPGFDETLRVNGKARITTEQTLMERFVVDGKLPRSVIVVDVQEVYLHCSKAVKRAQLWNPDAQIDRAQLPSAGQIFRDQLALSVEAEVVDEMLDRDARDNLY